jgi:hypothetical protein
MSKELYEEAIADLKKVKEVAEDNAKRAIVEAVAPRIRELIEKELLGESVDGPEEGMGCEAEEKDDEILTDKKPAGSEHDDSERGDKDSSSKDETMDVDEMTDESEVVENVVSPSIVEEKDEVEEKLLYIETMLDKLSTSHIFESKTLGLSLIRLNEMVEAIYGYIQECVEDPNVRLGYGLKLRKCLNKLEKLQETKMNRDLLNEEDVMLTITGLPDDLDLEGLGVTLQTDEGEESPEGEEGGEEEGEESPEGEEGGEEELDLDLGDESEGEEEAGKKEESLQLSDDMIVEIDEGMLRREISIMKILREEHDEAHDVQTWGHGAGDVSSEEDFEAEDLGEPLELDLSEALAELDGAAAQGSPKELEDYTAEAKPSLDTEEVEEMYEEVDEASCDEEDSGAAVDEELEEMMGQAHDKSDKQHSKAAQTNRQLRQTESIRSEMAKELKLQESLRGRAAQLKKLYESSKRVSSKASTLLERKEASHKQAQVKKAYAETADRYNASVTRFNELSQTLEEGLTKNVRSNSDVNPGASTGSDTLRKKLAETNLLNAKLLFTNKLLQAESLTARQKAQIIEQLDSAETIREAKLVYESLSKALMKTRTTVTEGRILGSSSQATRPASTQKLNEGFEAERWAKLAGIK